MRREHGTDHLDAGLVALLERERDVLRLLNRLPAWGKNGNRALANRAVFRQTPAQNDEELAGVLAEGLEEAVERLEAIVDGFADYRDRYTETSDELAELRRQRAAMRRFLGIDDLLELGTRADDRAREEVGR